MGFIDKKGIFVISPRFETGGTVYHNNFSEGLAKVEEKNQYGYINKKGDFVIEPQFEDVEEFKDGVAKIKFNGKWGLIDKNGNYFVYPTYDYITTFNEGLAGFTINGKLGYLNRELEIVIQPQFTINGPCRFQNGLAYVKFNDECVFINKKGEIITKNINFSHAEPERNQYQETTCSVCNGSGFCPDCGRTGRVKCSWHDTDGDGNCTECNNSGYISCLQCLGKGVCYNCNGSGKR